MIPTCTCLASWVCFLIWLLIEHQSFEERDVLSSFKKRIVMPS